MKNKNKQKKKNEHQIFSFDTKSMGRISTGDETDIAPPLYKIQAEISTLTLSTCFSGRKEKKVILSVFLFSANALLKRLDNQRYITITVKM